MDLEGLDEDGLGSVWVCSSVAVHFCLATKISPLYFGHVSVFRCSWPTYFTHCPFACVLLPLPAVTPTDNRISEAYKAICGAKSRCSHPISIKHNIIIDSAHRHVAPVK